MFAGGDQVLCSFVTGVDQIGEGGDEIGGSFFEGTHGGLYGRRAPRLSLFDDDLEPLGEGFPVGAFARSEPIAVVSNFSAGVWGCF